MTTPRWNTIPTYETSCRLPANMIWCSIHKKHAFQYVKEAVISNTTLRYFDPSLPLTIQVNASQVGLGAALLQSSKPMAFASKALTKTKCWYANIGREMLTVIFGAERFQMCVYSRSFTIESDHKPLESISQKNLVDMPAHLQHMLLCLQGYDYTIHYHPGKEMALPDTLSWFSPCPGPEILLDIAINHAHLSPERKEAFQQAFVSDPEMHALADMIITGWPKDIKAVPCLLHPYWQHWETLTIGDGFVLYGEALIISPSERERMLQKLLQFHQGTTKAQLFTCGCVFWSGINKAIEEAVWQCETCTQFQAQNAAAPLTPMPTPSCPWQMCTTDIFTLEGNWLPDMWWLLFKDDSHLTSSIQPEQHCQSHLTAQRNVLRTQNSQVLNSDNGPQYASAQFTEFCTSWGITHKTSSPHYLQSDGFAEACVKSMKHALQCIKYSGTDPQLALLALWATPIDTKLPSSAELL